MTAVSSSTRAFCVAFVVGAWIVGCDASPPPGETPRSQAASAQTESGAVAGSLPAAERFVGSNGCVECHSEVARRWRGSHHDRAMEVASPDAVLGRFDGRSLETGDRRWRFVSEAGEYRVELVEAGGPPLTLRVRYSFGVDPLQQYLVERPDGRLQALPVAWDVRSAEQGGQRFFSLQPDESIPPDDPLHWDRLAYGWNSQCAACHSTLVDKGYDAEAARFETTFAEIDVGCEACHGPGARHVAIQRGEAVADPSRGEFDVRFEAHRPDAWQRAPEARIASRRAPPGDPSQLEACAPCHSRRAAIVDSAAIGAPLLDGYRLSLIEPGLYFADGQIRDEVYVWGSFLQSRMHAAGVGCSDCHDPHSLELRRPGNALCTGCHAPDVFDATSHHLHDVGSEGSACVDCHMPARTYMEIDPRRDHSFPIPRPERSESLGVPNACDGCHAKRGSEWAAARIAEVRVGQRHVRPHWSDALLDGDVPRSDPARWLEIALELGESDIVRASAWRRFAEEADAAPAFETLSQRLREAGPLERMALVDVARGIAPEIRLALLRPLLEDPYRSIRVTAASALLDVPPGSWKPADRAVFARALREHREAQNANAERPEAQVNLGTLAMQLGDSEAARAAFERALAQAPYFVPAYANLADLERALGRDAESVSRLREAVALAPDEAMLRHALGLALYRMGDAEGARRELGAAVRSAPDQPRLVLAWALALQADGRNAEAIAALDEGLERRPGAGDLHHARTTLLRDAGELERARAAAEAFQSARPGDPRAAALWSELGPGS